MKRRRTTQPETQARPTGNRNGRRAQQIKAALLPTLVVVLAGVLMTEFGSSKLAPVREEVTRTSQQAELVRKQSLQGRLAITNQAVTDAENAAAVRRIPDDALLAEVIRQVDSLARRSNLSWTAGAPEPQPVTDETIPSGVRAWSMGATFTGQVKGIYEFLDQIDSLDRVVTIESLSLQQSGGDYTASAVLRFYALAE
jgi:Tfp pilus assembly protein PilO